MRNHPRGSLWAAWPKASRHGGWGLAYVTEEWGGLGGCGSLVEMSRPGPQKGVTEQDAGSRRGRWGRNGSPRNGWGGGWTGYLQSLNESSGPPPPSSRSFQMAEKKRRPWAAFAHPGFTSLEAVTPACFILWVFLKMPISSGRSYVWLIHRFQSLILDPGHQRLLSARLGDGREGRWQDQGAVSSGALCHAERLC